MTVDVGLGQGLDKFKIICYITYERYIKRGKAMKKEVCGNAITTGFYGGGYFL